MAGLQVTTAAMGRSSRDALEAVVERLKGGNRLAPVTVVPPNTIAGLSLRRSLAMRPGGVVNLRVLVLPRLIEFIGAPLLAAQGRRPLSDAFRIESIRAVVAETQRDLLGDVPLEGPALRSLDAIFADFDACDDRALQRIAAFSQRQRYLVSRYREFRERVRSFYDDRELAEAATLALRQGETSLLRDIGNVVLYLPSDLTSQQRSFLAALSERVVVEVVIGLSGDSEVDAHALAPWPEPQGRAAVAALPSAQRILQAPDAEEEVRDVIRRLGERARGGQPLHRVAILYAQRDPYQRIAAEQLDAAGIPWNGRLPITYGQTIVGRTLLSLLQIAERATRTPGRVSWGEFVAPWLSGAPILDSDGRVVPAARWNQIARKANLLQGPSQWLQRLGQYHTALLEAREQLLRDPDDEHPWRLRGVERDLREINEFGEFVGNFAYAIERTPATASWSEYATRAEQLLERYLGGRSAFANRLQDRPAVLSSHTAEDVPIHSVLSPRGAGGDVPQGQRGVRTDSANSAQPSSAPPSGTSSQEADIDRELDAWDTIHETLQSLHQLDDLGATDPARFLATVERGLQRPSGRVGRFGQGVFVGSLSEVVGTDWDLVFVLGAAERSLPPAQREDPLLPERLRGEVGLNGAVDLARRWRSQFLAALWSAPERRLSYPRADVRGQRSRMPSRWLLESASALQGQRVYGSRIDKLEGSDWFHAAPSFEWSIVNTPDSGAVQEYDLRSLRLATAPQRHFLALGEPALRRGFMLQQARRRPAFGEWDGRIEADTTRYADRPHSPTALQDWATCPYRYFLGRVLRIAERDESEDELSISALERGALIHDILDTFFKQSGGLLRPDDPWTNAHRGQLEAIADQKLDAAEARGVTGRRLLWTRERERIQNDLQELLSRDNERRSERGVVQIESEFEFGLGGESPVRFALPDGRTVELRGKIDRIDRSLDSSRLDVIDYKTGQPRPPASHLKADPVVAGQYLQLPIYGLAAEARYALPSITSLSTAYWFITERGEFRVRTVEWDSDNHDRFVDVLGRIIDGIDRGLFPAHPGGDAQFGPENCRYCPYDTVCPSDRQYVWNATKQDRRLARYVNLVEESPS